MQRIFKYSDMQHTRLTTDEELNSLLYMVPFYRLGQRKRVTNF